MGMRYSVPTTGVDALKEFRSRPRHTLLDIFKLQKVSLPVRIGIASDFHLGFGSGRRKGDAKKQARRAMDKLMEEDVDLIMLAGDVFDSPVPRPETLRDAAQVFRSAHRADSGVQLTGVGRDTPEVQGLPVVAIHGNHDRRVKGEVNPTQLLDLMGYAVYLHNSGVVADDVGIYGVGSVPETYSQKIFRSLDAKPFGDTSFFVFHQDIVPHIPRARLKLSDLPQGFDHYVNGHVHASSLEGNLLVVGSTVVTQLKKEEEEKCVWVWDGEFQKHPIASRPLYYFEVEAGGRKPSGILKEVDEALQGVLAEEQPEDPMVRVRVTGRLAEGFQPTDLLFDNDYGLFVSFHKDLEGSAVAEADVSQLDVDDMAVGVLGTVLKERKLELDAAELYAHLLKGDEAAVWRMLEAVL